MENELTNKLLELERSMEGGTSDIMPITWKLLHECKALAKQKEVTPDGTVWQYIRDVAAWFKCAEIGDGPIKQSFDKWVSGEEARRLCGDSIDEINVLCKKP